MAVDAQAISRQNAKGKAVHVIHTWKDSLFDQGNKSDPPDFIHDENDQQTESPPPPKKEVEVEEEEEEGQSPTFTPQGMRILLALLFLLIVLVQTFPHFYAHLSSKPSASRSPICLPIRHSPFPPPHSIRPISSHHVLPVHPHPLRSTSNTPPTNLLPLFSKYQKKKACSSSKT